MNKNHGRVWKIPYSAPIPASFDSIAIGSVLPLRGG
jgi:hypothetical protein